MATPNGRGGWDITDEEAAEIARASFGEDIAGGGGSADPEDIIKEPTEPGWYTYDAGTQGMIFLLYRSPLTNELRWFAVSDNGSMTPCVWGYIEQALSVFNLVRLVPELPHKTPAIGAGLSIGG